MSGRDPDTAHQQDLPWNDAPADSALAFGLEEPDPAEVVGEEGEEVDVSYAGVREPDAYHRDTLDERLAEEEPDRAAGAQDPEAGGLQPSEVAGGDLYAEQDEAEPLDPSDDGVEPAEDAAMHIRDPRGI